MPETHKKYPTLGCCGIDCGLCPRFYTKGDSVCPGCGGKNFKTKHPSCGCLSCCAIRLGLEVCSECREYPCRRFDPKGKNNDSFVSHARMLANLETVKNDGIKRFIGQQRIRMDVLEEWLAYFDEGRSKNLFCLSCALLPLDRLRAIRKFSDGLSHTLSLKEKNTQLRNEIFNVAKKLNVELKLNTRK